MAATKWIEEVSEWAVYSDTTGDDDYTTFEASFPTEDAARAFSKSHRERTGVWCAVTPGESHHVLYAQDEAGAWVRSPLNDYSVTEIEAMTAEQKQAQLLPAN